MLLDVLFVVCGLAGLYFGGDWLVDGSAKIARSFGLSPLIIGLTVVAFGTSTPELMVSISAAINGNSDIAIGNVVGSNIANIGLILGATGLILPIAVNVGVLRREIPLLLLVTALSAFLIADGEVRRLDGVIMVLGLIAFNGYMIYSAHKEREQRTVIDQTEEQDENAPPREIINRRRELMNILFGLLLLLAGAQLTVTGAVSMARGFGISELVIGITLVAIGTSLPELATSIVAAFHKQSDIAIGNVVGSNIYNLLSILGITAIIRPITVDPRVITFDGLIMIGFTLLLLPLVWNRVIQRREAALLLTCYMAFIVVTVTI